jgi:O-antigen/teichoic acid export membrane protein
MFLPAAALAPLGLAVSLVTYFSDLFNPVCQVFFPAAARLDARGELAALRRLYLQGSQIVLLLAAMGGVAAGFWAEDFMRLWLGAADGSGIISARTADLFLILLGAGICTVSRGIGRQIFLGTGRLHTLGLLLAGEAIVNLTLSVFLAPVLGLRGIVLATLIPAVLFQAFLHPWLLGRCLGISLWQYAAQVYIRPLTAALLVSAGALSIRVLGSANSWHMLGMQLSLLLALAAPAAVIVGLRREQRDALASKLPNRLAWSLGKAH